MYVTSSYDYRGSGIDNYRAVSRSWHITRRSTQINIMLRHLLRFNSSGKAVFSALTAFQFSELSVTSCSLQVKVGGVWRHDTMLTPPAYVAKNRYTYTAEKTYALNCAPGKTYRFKATFDADGHTITKYSNEVKF